MQRAWQQAVHDCSSVLHPCYFLTKFIKIITVTPTVLKANPSLTLRMTGGAGRVKKG
jgi:hypothetical protein